MTKETTPLGSYAVLPFQPKVPIVEKLSFLTDVMIARDGTENRIQLRELPRQNYQYTIPMSAWRRIRDIHTIRGAIRDFWYIPIWTESQFVGTTTASQTTFSIDPIYWREFQIDGLAFIFDSATEEFTIVQVAAKEQALLTVYAPGAEDMNSAWIMPMKKAEIIGDVKNDTNGLNSYVDIIFEIQDSTFMRTSSIGTEYKIPPITNGFTKRSYQQKQNIIDYGMAPVNTFSPRSFADHLFPYTVVAEGAEEIWNWKNFLYNCAGRFNSFLMPSFEYELKIQSTGTITTTVAVDSGSIIDYMTNQSYVAFKLTSDSWIIKPVTSYEQTDPDTVTITLAVSLDKDRSEIEYMCFASTTRLDTDLIELDWSGNNIVTSKVTMRGIETL